MAVSARWAMLEPAPRTTLSPQVRFWRVPRETVLIAHPGAMGLLTQTASVHRQQRSWGLWHLRPSRLMRNARQGSEGVTAHCFYCWPLA